MLIMDQVTSSSIPKCICRHPPYVIAFRYRYNVSGHGISFYPDAVVDERTNINISAMLRVTQCKIRPICGVKGLRQPLQRREENETPTALPEEADHHRSSDSAVDKFFAHNHFRLTRDTSSSSPSVSLFGPNTDVVVIRPAYGDKACCGQRF